MSMYYIIIIIYFLIGIFILFLTPFKFKVKKGYNEFVKDYFKNEKKSYNILGLLGLLFFVIILFIFICIYPMVFLVKYLVVIKRIVKNQDWQKLFTLRKKKITGNIEDIEMLEFDHLQWYLKIVIVNEGFEIESTGGNIAFMALEIVADKLNEFTRTILPTIPNKASKNGSSFFLTVDFLKEPPYNVLKYKNNGVGYNDIKSAIIYLKENVFKPS